MNDGCGGYLRLAMEPAGGGGGGGFSSVFGFELCVVFR